MDDVGKITISLDDFLLERQKPYSRAMAWIEIIQESSLNGGKLTISERVLAQRWQQTRHWVRSLIEHLEKIGLIEVDKDSKFQSIRVVEIERYFRSSTNVNQFSTNMYTDNQSVKLCSQPMSTNPQPMATNGNQSATNMCTENQLVNRGAQPIVNQCSTNQEKRKKKEEKREEEIFPLTIPFIEEPKKEEINKEEKKDSGELTNVSSLSTTSVDAAADVDWKKFLDFFNATVNGSQIPKIRTITEERKKFIRARVKEFGKNALAVAVKKAAASDFLNGCGNKAFVASFDWIFRPTNFPKVLEGNYDNKNLDYANRRDNGKTQRDIDRERRDREAAEIMSRLAEGLY